MGSGGRKYSNTNEYEIKTENCYIKWIASISISKRFTLSSCVLFIRGFLRIGNIQWTLLILSFKEKESWFKAFLS